MSAALAAPRRSSWFEFARFGIFVHYGLYSIAGRHEWVQKNESIPADTYARYADYFDADRFDARKLAAAIRGAGAGYVVLTTKHHEGFCLWDSSLTSFTSAQAPAGRDLVAEMTTACREEGLRVGFYYSLIDWHHPDFPVDGLHPEWAGSGRKPRDGQQYVKYLHGQVQELVTTHNPDLLWFDFSYPTDALAEEGKGASYWDSRALVEMIQSLSPNLILNDRLDLPGSEDFSTPEDVQPAALSVRHDGLWEVCRTMNGSWGYAPGYQDWLDAEQSVRLVIDSVSRGGNLLLNVSPTARGDLEHRAEAVLTSIGEWFDLHDVTIRGAGPSPLTPPDGCRLTARDDRTFLHVVEWPSGHIILPKAYPPVLFARFVHDGTEVRHDVIDSSFRRVPHAVPPGPDGATVLNLPRRRPDVAVPVIELHFDEAASAGVEGTTT